MRKYRTRQACAVVIMILCCMIFMPGATVSAAEAYEPETVKVGFFQFDGYHEINEMEMMSGYGYDFLQMIAGYANLNYEYIGYERSWDDMLQMLESGEIDLLTFTRYTDDRAQHFEYSENPVGYTSVILTTTLDQKKLRPGDYASYNGMRVGMLTGSTQESEMQQFCEQHDFEIMPVFYDTLSELKQALNEKKEVDAILTSSIRAISGELVLEQFNETAFYAVVRKDNAALMDRVDYAMSMMDTYNPDWKDVLNERNHAMNASYFSLSKNETDYLESLYANGGKIRVLVNPDMKPYSYFDHQTPKGIIIDYFNEICKLYNLEAEYVNTGTSRNYFDAVMEKKTDVVLAPNVIYQEADKAGYYLTRSFLKAPISMVISDGKEDLTSNAKIAVVSGMSSIAYAASVDYHNDEIVSYDTSKDCIRAVEDGEVDGALLYTYSAVEYVNSDWKQKLKILDYSNDTVGFIAAVPKGEDNSLYGLMSYGIYSVDDAKIQSIINKNIYTQENADEPVWLYIYRNPPILLTIIGIIIFCMILILLLRNQEFKLQQIEQRKKAEAEKQKERYERFKRGEKTMQLLSKSWTPIISYIYVKTGNCVFEDRDVTAEFSKMMDYDRLVQSESRNVISEERSEFIKNMSLSHVLEIIKTYGEFHYTANMIRKQNQYYQIAFHASFFDDAAEKILLVSEDVTDANARDPITGVLNRQGFMYRVGYLLEHAVAQDDFYMLDFDILKFKSVNARYDLETGDAVLRKAAAFLRESPLKPLCVCRNKDDRFFCFVRGENVSEANFLKTKSFEYELNDGAHIFEFNCGIYQIIDPHMPVISICDCAMLALQKAKEDRMYKGVYVFDDELRRNYLNSVYVLEQLETAIQNKEFTVMYQPIIDLESGRIASAEALVRWYNPKQGLISPAVFIPTLEREGKVYRLDAYVRQTVQDFLSARYREGRHIVPVSLNLSRTDFYHQRFLKQCLEAVETTVLPVDSIRYEITESSMMDIPKSGDEFVSKMHRLGCKFLVDDFGTGTSSLQTVAKQDYDIIKLDKTFIDQIGTESRVEAVISTSIDLAHKLKLYVVAEGVETEAQYLFLKKNKCDYIQGYYFSKPVSEEAFAKMLDAQ